MANIKVQNYAEKWQRELDQTLMQGLLTAELETPEVNWLDAKSFRVPHVKTSGYQNHKRNQKGFNAGTIDIEDEIYTLNFDRDVEFYVDKADVDETNQAASAGNITRVFSQENAIPEIDAYRFSKLAQTALSESMMFQEVITKENVVEVLKAQVLKIRRYGTQNLVCYVSSQVMDCLEQSPFFTRNISVQNVEGTDIETRITSLDGLRLREVWCEERFYDSFDFTEGFVPKTTSKKLNYLIVAKPAIKAKAKFSSVYLFAPGQVGQGDGWLYQNRLYHDLFKMKHQKNTVIASTVGEPKEGMMAPVSKVLSGVSASEMVNYSEMSKLQLQKLLKEKGIEFEKSDTNEMLIASLQENE